MEQVCDNLLHTYSDLHVGMVGVGWRQKNFLSSSNNCTEFRWWWVICTCDQSFLALCKLFNVWIQLSRLNLGIISIKVIPFQYHARQLYHRYHSEFGYVAYLSWKIDYNFQNFFSRKNPFFSKNVHFSFIQFWGFSL